MSAWLVIDGVQPWDGRYEIDWEFTNQELYDIKRVSRGVRPAELLDALDSHDPGAFVGLAVVLLQRAGNRVDEDQFWHAAAGSLSIEIDDEDDAVPLTTGDSASATSGS